MPADDIGDQRVETSVKHHGFIGADSVCPAAPYRPLHGTQVRDSANASYSASRRTVTVLGASIGGGLARLVKQAQAVAICFKPYPLYLM